MYEEQCFLFSFVCVTSSVCNKKESNLLSSNPIAFVFLVVWLVVFFLLLFFIFSCCYCITLDISVGWIFVFYKQTWSHHRTIQSIESASLESKLYI